MLWSIKPATLCLNYCGSSSHPTFSVQSISPSLIVKILRALVVDWIPLLSSRSRFVSFAAAAFPGFSSSASLSSLLSWQSPPLRCELINWSVALSSWVFSSGLEKPYESNGTLRPSFLSLPLKPCPLYKKSGILKETCRFIHIVGDWFLVGQFGLLVDLGILNAGRNWPGMFIIDC